MIGDSHGIFPPIVRKYSKLFVSLKKKMGWRAALRNDEAILRSIKSTDTNTGFSYFLFKIKLMEAKLNRKKEEKEKSLSKAAAMFARD